MNKKDLIKIVQSIVKQSSELKNKFTDEQDAPVNYACIFSQSDAEYEEFQKSAGEIGKIIKETPSGPLFHIEPIKTVSEDLKLLKIRKPDETKPESGDADFTVSNYQKFKQKHLLEKGFKLIERDYMEMIELMSPEFNVRTYFSDPPLDKQLKIN